MTDTKMLQILIDGQTEIKKQIKDLEIKLSGEIKENGSRIDRLGKQLAYLEDDTPTIEEFDELKESVDTIKNQTASI